MFLQATQNLSVGDWTPHPTFEFVYQSPETWRHIKLFGFGLVNVRQRGGELPEQRYDPIQKRWETIGKASQSSRLFYIHDISERGNALNSEPLYASSPDILQGTQSRDLVGFAIDYRGSIYSLINKAIQEGYQRGERGNNVLANMIEKREYEIISPLFDWIYNQIIQSTNGNNTWS